MSTFSYWSDDILIAVHSLKRPSRFQNGEISHLLSTLGKWYFGRLGHTVLRFVERLIVDHNSRIYLSFKNKIVVSYIVLMEDQVSDMGIRIFGQPKLCVLRKRCF